MRWCDNCSKILTPLKTYEPEEDIWQKEYNKRKDKIVSLEKRKYKRLLKKMFAVPSMPFYRQGSFCWCSKKCYLKWKVLALKRFKERSNK